MSSDYKGEFQTRCPWQTSADTQTPAQIRKSVIRLLFNCDARRQNREDLNNILTCCLKSFSWAFVLCRKRFLAQSPDVNALKAFSKLSCFLKRSMSSFNSSCLPLIGRNLQKTITGIKKNRKKTKSINQQHTTQSEKMHPCTKQNAFKWLCKGFWIIISTVTDLLTWCSSCVFESPGMDPGWGSWSDHHSHTTP